MIEAAARIRLGAQGRLELAPPAGGAAPRPGAPRGAMEHAGRLLGRRPRTAAELVRSLRSAGFGPDEVEAAIARLRELGLVDDREFARQWLAQRCARRPTGRAALVAALEAKGVAAAVAREAVEEAGYDEEAQAVEVAARLLPTVGRGSVARQAAALHGRLVRRGFSAEAVEAAVRAVLPPDGWD
ncbi:MAG TPA: regulatory protein RecX [Actinomycetota bacterium]|nr:regulatory protein RecX [Actinomycetota bacterium]